MFNRDERIPLGKLTFVQYVILAIFLVLGFRLARLQVGDSERYSTLAERNRVRTIPILAPRGKILDREGRVIGVEFGGLRESSGRVVLGLPIKRAAALLAAPSSPSRE